MRSRRLYFGFGAAVLFFNAHFSEAATFTIANGDLVGLSNAILASNSNGEDDVINLAILGTYTLTTQLFTTTGFDGLPRIEADSGHSLTINGRFSTIQRSSAGGTPNFRIFDLATGTNVTFTLLGIKNGKSSPVGGGGPQYDEGGGICNRGGTIALLNCTLDSNSGKYGGGVYNPSGSASFSNCVLSNNTASFSGGGLYNAGDLAIAGCAFNNNGPNAIDYYNLGAVDVPITNTSFTGNTGSAIHVFGECSFVLTQCTFTNNNQADYGAAIFGFDFSSWKIVNCTFSGNTAFLNGGAIFLSDASAVVTGSTFNGNSAPEGGAIAGSPAGVSLSNCTFSGNSANYGAGVEVSAPSNNNVSTLSVTNSTFSGNNASQAGGGIYVVGSFGNSIASATITNSIFKTGAAGANLARAGFPGESITSQGANISNDAGGGFLTAAGDQTNVDPQLDVLGSNGGPTQTHALLPASPAINAGNDSNAPPRDQRGYSRNGVSDIGAFELGGRLIPLSAVSRKIHGATAFDLNLPLTGPTVGVECRRNTGLDSSGPNAGHDHQVIVTFPYSVTIDSATADHSVTADLLADASNQVYTLNLHNVPNAQLITLTLNNVRDNTNTFTDTIPMGVLLGDVNGDSFVLSGDYTAVRQRSGAAVNGTNFQYDINADGFILSGDYTTVRQLSGSHLSANPASSWKLRVRNW